MTDRKDDIEMKPYQSKSHYIHGHHVNGICSPTYQSWLSMKTRCKHKHRDPENKYINRGIGVCDEWVESFECFLSDMGERPAGMTLDRVDNDLGYSKENCRWATVTEQARNRRNTRLNYEQALDIAKRMLAGETAVSLSKEYKISESLPREIHKGRTWKDAHNDARKT